MKYMYNDITIYYERIGKSNKKTIIIFPGWGDNRSTFYNIINYFKDKYCIYIFDYPGFGKSDSFNTTLSIYDYAELFYNFILDMNINNPYIIAHSFGGRITAILLGKYNLNVEKLVLIDVAGIKRLKKISLLFKQFSYKLLKKIKYILPKKLRYLYLEKLISIFGSTDYKNINSSMRNTFKNIVNEDLRKYYKLIKSSTLIIWGDNDYDTPLKDAYLLNKYITDSAVIIYKNSSHFSYLEYSLYTNKILASFFD